MASESFQGKVPGPSLPDLDIISVEDLSVDSDSLFVEATKDPDKKAKGPTKHDLIERA